jgi:hypothetical protein
MMSTNMPAPTTINSEKLPDNPQIGVSCGPDKRQTEPVKDDVHLQGEPGMKNQQDAPNSQPEVVGSPPQASTREVDDGMNEEILQPESTTEVDDSQGVNGLSSEGENDSPGNRDGLVNELESSNREGSVNEHQTERRSARTHQPSNALIESRQSEKIYSRKCKAEGEQDDDNHPAQRMRAQLARFAIATELMIGDREYEVANKVHEKAGIRIPKSYSEAINDPVYGAKWKEAIHKELSTLMSFRTWKVIPQKQAEGNISTCRWVFDVKLGLDGRIDRFRARLVARGNEQSEDDFDETFTLVFQLDSLRILCAIAARYGLIAHLMDALNAFAGSKLDKPNCMEIPEGLQDFDPDAKGGMVLKLLMSLYGLHQSAYLWHRKISQFLKSIGFDPITADPSIFINKRGLIIALYVDDIVIFSRDEGEIDAVKRKLKEFHPMTDGGLVKKLLGIRFTWRKDGSICLDQEPYAHQILEEFGMGDCKPADVPISPSVKLNSEDTPQLGWSEHKLFQRLIG